MRTGEPVQVTGFIDGIVRAIVPDGFLTSARSSSSPVCDDSSCCHCRVLGCEYRRCLVEGFDDEWGEVSS
jgi:hypothetical protein